jgi:hypothetical protein
MIEIQRKMVVVGDGCAGKVCSTFGAVIVNFLIVNVIPDLHEYYIRQRHFPPGVLPNND